MVTGLSTNANHHTVRRKHMSTAMTRKIALFAGVFYLGIGALGFVPKIGRAHV